ncbi:hypothetical protein [Streptomyces sp. NBC_01565]|uniref:hypothetical protein n=1 Tax=Streptomyces sp. NBC_01565 TaxID=2975881 RepID=UPI0022551613|nr:hypothetical protein [Streptomyces sp. NBC_01565]MCX4543815.1 hypothetical protein [Streptomyces sp. NBC_01565]
MTHKPVTFYAEAGTGDCPHGTDGDHPRHAPGGEVWICLDIPVGDGCDTHTDDWGYGVMWGDCLGEQAES